MAKTVVGVFEEEQYTEDAIAELKDLGYDPKEMSVIMKDVRQTGTFSNAGTKVAGGAATGAATGAVVGGLAGLLVGIGAIAIPGVGAFLVGGPLAVALGLTGAAATTASGAATGAIAGGLIGALVSLGIPENDARRYEERIRAGGILLAVPTLERRDQEVIDIMKEFGASDVKTLGLPEVDEEDLEERDVAGGVHDDEEYANRRYAYRHRNMHNKRSVK